MPRRVIGLNQMHNFSRLCFPSPKHLHASGVTIINGLCNALYFSPGRQGRLIPIQQSRALRLSLSTHTTQYQLKLHVSTHSLPPLSLDISLTQSRDGYHPSLYAAMRKGDGPE